MFVVPLVIWVVANDPRLAFEVLLGHSSSHKISIWNRLRICHRNRIFQDHLNGPPYIDDLISFLYQFVCFVRELPSQSSFCSNIGLVDVCLGHRTTIAEVIKAKMVPLGWATTDLVIEDMYARCPSNALQEIFAFFVVSGLDRRLVNKIRLTALMLTVLKAMTVQRVFVFVAADIVHYKVMTAVWAFIRDPAFSDKNWCWKRTVSWVVPVIQRGRHMVFRALVPVGGWWGFMHVGCTSGVLTAKMYLLL